MTAGHDEEAARLALDATVATTLRVLRGAVILLVVIFLTSGIFTVSEHEVAFVRRLGRVVGETGEERLLRRGVHWAWPALDEVVRVPSERTDVASTAAFTLELTEQEQLRGQPPARKGGLDPARDGYVVTGDGGIIHLRPAARTRVRDPLGFVQRASNAPGLVRVLLERAVARAAAARGAGEVILERAKRDGLVEDARAATQRALDDLGSGVEVVGVDLEPAEPGRDLAPSPQMRGAFQAVQNALQDQGKRRSDAQARAAEIRSRGLAEAARRRAQAEAEARRIGTDTLADAAVFKDRLAEHRRAPRALEARLLAETLETALGQVDDAFLLRRGARTRIRLERDTSQLREELERRLKEDAR